MIVIDRTILSDDIVENHFVCNLSRCKGGCCVEGDLGAPLETEEMHTVDRIYDKIEPYLTDAGRQAIEQQGRYVLDEDKEYSTPTVNGKECAYAIYDEKGVLRCSFEMAFQDGKTDFRKPISCHLYPIRITRYDSYDALNYDRWEICLPACELGKKLKIPLYKFCRDALIRKYGKEWYDKLCRAVRKTILKTAEK
jgi:hypothetical protein